MPTTQCRTRPRKSLTTRKAAPAAAALAMLVAASAWAGYNVWTGDYTFSRQELQDAVDKRFPARLRYAQVLDVQLTQPRLLLDEANNRVTTRMDAQVSNTLLPAPPINGTLSLSSGLRYDPAKRAVLLDNPSVERVQVAGMPAQYGEQLNAIGAVVAQQLLRDYPLYTFKPEELHVAGKDVEPGAITVLADGIKVQVNTR
ncbi:putative transmembrane protein [Cupriavidus basilensis]|uniref:Putative transmembrane protein n=2 Tax=Cupriavidus basilensis TaxID=68895 RepID=A0A0C4YSL7_9BURK|nr:putative transmembrane protein [Cupriavidus basilensis]